MAKPESESPQQTPLERLESLRARHRELSKQQRELSKQQIVAQPDAINETVRADGTYLGQELLRRAMEDRQTREQLQQRREQLQLRVQSFRRADYRARKKDEQERGQQTRLVTPFEVPVEAMSDAFVDAALAQEARDAAYRASQPQIGPANPVWSYPAETRRALGYYTQEEREQAARLNDMRSSTFFGNVMPNFGRLAAYNHPGAEMDAFRQTALYLPNAVVAGASFGLPSATQATLAGARAGWQTAGNLALRTLQAGTQAARSAATVVTNPRWAATTTALMAPVVAQASNGEGGGPNLLAWGIGVPLAIGTGAYIKGKLGKLWGQAPTAAPSILYAYQPNRKLFTWEHPSSWGRRLREAIRDSRMAEAIDEWNAVAGDPTKELAFINKYNIREAEATPQWVERTVTEPKTYRAPVMETVQEPVMESVPSSVLGPDGKPLMIQKPRSNADGIPITRSVEREVRDASGNPMMYDKPVFDEQGQPIMDTYTRSEPKLGEDGKQIVIYNPIDRGQVSAFLLGSTGKRYTSTIGNVGDIVLKGPTKSLQFWMGARNAGRVGTWLVPGFIGYKWLTSSSGAPANNANNPNANNPNANNATNSVLTVTPDSVRVRPFISVTPDGRVVVQSVSGTGNDTIVLKNYETPLFDD